MRLWLFAAMLAMTGLASLPAQAQYGSAPAASKRFKGQATQAPSQPPPSALPGAAPTFAPAEKTETDLPPTEALFDAINRGDIASARDALGRGADLNAHNVLGMTPLELSVDLSRNDITFLLLSLRGADTSRPGLAASGTKPAPAKARPAQTAASHPAPKAPKPAPAAAATLPTRQYAGQGDGGTPSPQAGFLGFGGTVQ